MCKPVAALAAALASAPCSCSNGLTTGGVLLPAPWLGHLCGPQDHGRVKEAWGYLQASGLPIHITCANSYMAALLKEVGRAGWGNGRGEGWGCGGVMV